MSAPERSTERLDLHRPVLSDLPHLHALYSDPRVWEHFPSRRHVTESETRDMLEQWIADWGRDGLGNWMVREQGRDDLLGHAGCSLRGQQVRFWNLGYRFHPDAQGRGFAQEASRAAIAAAREHSPAVPVVAYLLESNPASARLARRLDLTERHRGPDAANPDPAAVRLVFSDRGLSAQELAETLR